MKKSFFRVVALFLVLVVLSTTSLTFSASGIYGGLSFLKISGVDEYCVYSCSTDASGYIQIPDTYNGLPVTLICESAFAYCRLIDTVVIGANVKTIQGKAFMECSSLKNVRLGVAVQKIEEGAFEGCSSLAEVSITNIKKWCEINFSSPNSNPLYLGADLFLDGEKLTDVILPSDLTMINKYAFYNSKICSVSILGSGTHIGEYAFYNSRSLSSVKINGSLTSIGNFAFCGCVSLSYVDFSNGLYSIGDSAFYNCSSLESLDFSAGLRNIGSKAFYNCTKVGSLVLPNVEMEIGDQAFGCCYALNNIVVPDNVKNIGNDVFVDTGYYRNSDNWENEVLYIGNYLIASKATVSGDCNIRNGTKYVLNYAFKGCTELTGITIPDSVLDFGKETFSGCSKLEYALLSNNISCIKYNSFKDCASLATISIPDSVTIIESGVFEGCKKLQTLKIGSNVSYIGADAFADCTSLKNVYISNLAKWCEIEFGAGSTITKTNPLCRAQNLYINDELTEDLVIPNWVGWIAPYAFYYCPAIKTLVVTDGVKSIGYKAFYGCASLKKAEIGNGVEEIGMAAFEDCSGLYEIEIGKNVKKIGAAAFYDIAYYKNLNNWENNTSILYIGDYLIDTRVANYQKFISGEYSIKEGTKCIADSAFLECKKLTSISIPNSVTSIGDNAFYNCSSLTSVIIPDSVASIGEWAFSGCGSLKSVHITSLASWCSIDFAVCSANPLYYAKDFYLNEELITDLVIPEGVTSIGKYAFYGSRLKDVNIPASVTNIGEKAFGYYQYDNRECEIAGFTIRSVVGSEAERYANKNRFIFVDVNHTHSYTESITKQPTCTEAGEKTFTCSCGDSYTTPVAALGHNYSNEYTVDKSPTCDSEGSESRHCTRCDEKTDVRVIPKLKRLDTPTILTTESTENGVKFTWSAVEGADGYTVFKLVQDSTGNYVYKALATVGASTLAFTDWTAVDGETYCYAVCAMNNSGSVSLYAEFAFTYVKHTHSYNIETITVQPTCTESGIKNLSCTCGDTKTEVIPALGHDFSAEFTVDKEATVTEEGSKSRHCSRCDEKTEVTAIPKLTPPLATPVAKTANTAKGIKVTWNKVDNAQKYVVYRRFYSPTNKRWSGWVALKTTTGLSFTDTTTKIGINYRYTVKAVNGSNVSGIKSTSNIKFDVKPTVTVANASNGIKVSWSTVANATGYTVYSSTYNSKTKKWSGWKNRGTTKANAKSWVDKSAKAGTVYKYTVRARNGSVASSFVASASLVRLVNPTVKVAKASNGVKVTWNKIAGAKNYKIYRATYVNGKWSGWSGIVTTNNKTFAFTDKTAKKGVYYKYTVRAVNGKSASAFTASGNVKR